MPELPEVETYGRYFARHALGQTIARVEVRDARILGETREQGFVRGLRGRAFTDVRRHGKHLFIDAGTSWLHLHFGMSGDLAYYRDPAEEPRFTRIVFEFDNGAKLAFEDMRLFGLADLVRDPDAFIAERGLGPDPLDPKFTAAKFASLLAGRRGAIKSLLMTQELIAGLGNLYVDELLYQSHVHPRRPVDQISGDEARVLFRNMRKILREAITRLERRAAYPAKYLIEHREEGARCPWCGGNIARTVVFGRTTYFCRKHQQ